MSSSRLPGKVLMPFYNGKSILEIQIDTIREVIPNLMLVVATTTNSKDDEIVEFCKKREVDFFRGSESDVLDRFIKCGDLYDAENIIRVCSDNPFLIGKYLQELENESRGMNVDYVSYKNVLGVPSIKTHWGLFAELVSVSALKKVVSLTREKFYHEHVTNYIYENKNDFKVNLIQAPTEVYNRSDLRYTIDTIDDFKNLQFLYQKWDVKNLVRLIGITDDEEAIKRNMEKGIEKFTK